MPPRRSVRRGGRGGRGVGRNQREGQPEGQLAIQAIDPTAPVTQADLVTME